MRLALISDIHGNNVALEAVLTAISTQNITQVICLGDVASTGPQPCEVIKRLREMSCPVVMGNMDAWLLQPEPKEQPDLRRQRWQEMDLWCAGQLSSADRAYLRSFQRSLEYPLLDEKTLVCYHGSPRSYNERILPTTPEEELEQALAGTRGDLMVGGHTHVQMFRRFKDLLVFNPGSVGLAMDRVSPLSDIRQPAFAEYAIVEYNKTALQVELHRIAFDLQAFIQVIERLRDAPCSLVGQPLEGGGEMAISPRHAALAEIVEKACQVESNIFGYGMRDPPYSLGGRVRQTTGRDLGC